MTGFLKIQKQERQSPDSSCLERPQYISCLGLWVFTALHASAINTQKLKHKMQKSIHTNIA